jgi:hypothetical protein
MRQEEVLDEALKNTFPASDPISVEQPWLLVPPRTKSFLDIARFRANIAWCFTLVGRRHSSGRVRPSCAAGRFCPFNRVDTVELLPLAKGCNYQAAGTNKEQSMPSSLQYPLGRQRDLQRRWSRLLQRTAPSDDNGLRNPRHSRSSLAPTSRLGTNAQGSVAATGPGPIRGDLTDVARFGQSSASKEDR